MGWAGGSGVMCDIIRAAKKAIPSQATRREFYIAAIDAFEKEDWDTQDECRGLDMVFDSALDVQGQE